MGRVRYGLWWLDQATAGVRDRTRVVVDGTATVGRELRWATELSVRATLAGIDHARPEPWSDRGLTWLFGVIAVVAVAVAVLLGTGMAHWAMTSSDAMLFAAAGALAVGLVFLPLAYLVFASGRRSRRH
ncbi:hypothetical protein [Nocardiopsis sp. MG754419]|uniref:hypothetical protein n=1 Tax=Nocardiopsis sp. MG754419 TaxID=2259865 RepID=UPI001BAAD80D|nr:hypothetical protein [Nocardiopsis sp. MG754419]MBR8741494.1 hypothetical protein [Nocardiopsis sp. MG754419]